MNILLSGDCFYPAPMGGPSHTIYWQAKALTQAGHAVTVLATSYCLPQTVPRNQWLAMDCGQVMYTQNPHFYWPVKHCWYGWQAIQKADVVHVNSLFYPASLVWVILCRLANKPVVWSPHGELNPVALSFRKTLKWGILQVVHRLSSSVSFHATSAAEADAIRQYLGPSSQVTLIPNRMELPECLTPAWVEPPYLLFIGRLHPIKAIDCLIAALAQSQVFRDSHYTLLIAGPVADETYVQTLKAQIAQAKMSTKIRFVDSVQGRQKQRLYANARLTIVPSHAESFGNVVIESLAQGTPVIASVHTPWQLLDQERIGSWVANDPDSLRRTIDWYLTMPLEEYNAYRERALRVVHQQFDVMKHVAAWERFYEQVLSGSKCKISACT